MWRGHAPKKILPVLAVAALGVAAGCRHHLWHPHGLPPGQAKKMVHVHGVGCGHVLIDGTWVLVTPHKARVEVRGKHEGR